MFFCPKCSYSLDLKKSAIIGNKTVVATTEKKVPVKSVSAGINKIFKEQINPNTIKPTFNKDQMLKNKNYGKLSMEDKNKMLEIFNQSGGATGAMFLCNNCGWINQIDSTIKLYTFDNLDKTTLVSPNEYFMIFNNPILSRTKDYTCKNKNCQSHTKNNIKEAVFFHNGKTLQVRYICGVCYNSWFI